MKLLSLVAGVALLAQPALVQAETHQIPVDPVHSQVGFSIRHLVSKVPGHFDEFSGTITIDPANVASTLKIEGTVQAASINTRNEKRDGHLRSEDFFAVEKYPEITFVSKSVTKDGDDYEISGDLTMRGVTKRVVLEAEYGGVATNPFTGTPTVGLSLEGEVNRKDFGIEWNKTLDAGGVMLGDEVDIRIEIEATVPPPAQGEQS
jgi:polyisoprenoid-binding protein YceI